jgi:hypothetical protein
MQDSDCPYSGAPYMRMRSIIILFALVIVARAAVGQDADDLRTVIPRLHGQPAMVRNMAGEWEAAVIVYQDANVELSVPFYLLDGELAVKAVANAPLPLPWDGNGGYEVVLYSFYKARPSCTLDVRTAGRDNTLTCKDQVRYQQRILAIDPHKRTVTELHYVLIRADGEATLPLPWPEATYSLDGPSPNAHVAMLRAAIAKLQPLVNREVAANVRWLSAYHKQFEQAREIARESVTPPGDGRSILQETPELRARLQKFQTTDSSANEMPEPIVGHSAARIEPKDLPKPAVTAQTQQADGIYVQNGSSWDKLYPASSMGSKASGVAKSAFSYGIAKAKVELTYRDAEAPVSTSNPRPIFKVVGPLQVAPRDIVIVRVQQKKDHRELQVGKMGALSGFSMQYPADVVTEVSVQKSEDGVTTITPVSGLKPGQYILFAGQHSPYASSLPTGVGGFDFGVK